MINLSTGQDQLVWGCTIGDGPMKNFTQTMGNKRKSQGTRNKEGCWKTRINYISNNLYDERTLRDILRGLSQELSLKEVADEIREKGNRST